MKEWRTVWSFKLQTEINQMFKTVVKYRILHTYCGGYLIADHYCNSIKEVKKFIQEYKHNFNDCEKSYVVQQIIILKLFNIAIKTETISLYDEYIG